MSTDEQTQRRTGSGLGHTVVEMLDEVERTMDAARHVYPATDHLARPTRRPSDANLASLRGELAAEDGTLAAAYERWRSLAREFFVIADDLEGYGSGCESPSDADDLDQLIVRLHRHRAELVAASEELRRVVADELDRRLG